MKGFYSLIFFSNIYYFNKVGNSLMLFEFSTSKFSALSENVLFASSVRLKCTSMYATRYMHDM